MAKLGVTNLYDPASNILVGIDLLAEYYHTYGSWNQALTAYRTGNAGSDSAYAATILGIICISPCAPFPLVAPALNWLS